MNEEPTRISIIKIVMTPDGGEWEMQSEIWNGYGGEWKI
jgi:hypothetical protein